MDFKHIPVMLNEVIDGLNIKKDGVYVDCTVGGAGHSLEIAKRLKNGHLYCFDRDQEAIDKSTQVLQKYKSVVTLVIDGFLVDLGVSSHQIDEGKRGFSFVHDGPLDMRMDIAENVPTAKELVNTLSVQELERIFREYGEEEFSKSIAKNIVKAREESEISTTGQLKDIIENSMPKKVVFSRSGASKKVFQALRIYVNKELDGLDTFLTEMISLLSAGGRAVVLTFHSLEDRIVKNAFKLESTDCICPPKTPVCICHHKARLRLVTRKPVVATETEQKANSRSTSAKLRIAERL